MVEAIRVVAAGGTYLYSPLVSKKARSGAKGSWQEDAFDRPEPLTERERLGVSDRTKAVLQAMAKGLV